MKPKDQHLKLLASNHWKDARWESPLRTPTTLTSFSFSSQELATSHGHRQRAPSASECDDLKPKEVKSFHDEYLEFGMWPEMSLRTQAELKSKYKQRKLQEIETRWENSRLKSEIKAVKAAPCVECEIERERHSATKKALEEAVALSSALLQQVLEMDEKSARPKLKSMLKD